MVATSGAGTDYPSGAPALTPAFRRVRVTRFMCCPFMCFKSIDYDGYVTVVVVRYCPPLAQ
jgi:hypothetical protein